MSNTIARAFALTSTAPAASGAALTVTLDAPEAAHYLTVTIARDELSGRDAAETLPPLHLLPGDVLALRDALDDVIARSAALNSIATA